VHGVLLWPGDIVGAYGLLAVLMAVVLVRGAPGTLAGIAVTGAVVSSLFLSGSALAPPPGTTALMPSVAATDPVSVLLLHAVEWGLIGLLVQSIAVFGAVALGALAKRRSKAVAV
jgi:uncharacterized membrane protein YeiB